MSTTWTFTVPTLDQIHQASNNSNLPEFSTQSSITSSNFNIISKPRSGDWLYSHEELGQSITSFLEKKINRPTKEKDKLYFLPLGDYRMEETEKFLGLLREYSEIFFNLPIVFQEHQKEINFEVTSRINENTHLNQLLTKDIMKHLKKTFPSDAFCYTAITNEDLYPDPSWNFVFGQGFIFINPYLFSFHFLFLNLSSIASLTSRVGVYSFSRYTWLNDDESTFNQMLLRSLKVMTHEVCHQFGMHHCIYYNCLLNGSNHLGIFSYFLFLISYFLFSFH